MGKIIAQCHANGVIFFDKKLRKDAISIMKGKTKKVKQIMKNRARHTYDGKALLVPGLPEAASPNDRIKALLRFTAFCKKK